MATLFAARQIIVTAVGANHESSRPLLAFACL
jgi:hypothetical protein